MKFGKTYDMTEIQNLTAMYGEMLAQLNETEAVLARWKFLETFMDLHKNEVPVEGRTYWHSKVRDLEKSLADITGCIDYRIGDLGREMKDLQNQVAKICGVNVDGFTALTKEFEDSYAKYLASEKKTTTEKKTAVASDVVSSVKPEPTNN